MPSLTANIPEFQAALVDWYAQAQRPLPWRTEPSVYRTVVSELMAQQTQIKTMLPYFERWMQRFPDFEALAAADSDDVLKHWEGLGYYSRARNLHKLAKTYVAMEPKPTTREEWQVLPGIGPYTSAAISSIAQGYPAAVVDGNVVRILARLTHDKRAFKNNGEAVKAFTALADEALNTDKPGDHNQAMMELGATVCQKHNPMCTVCPVVSFCAGAAQGSPEQLPKIERAATKRVEVDRLWIVADDKVLLHRIPNDAKQLAGQYELPRAETFGLTEDRGQKSVPRSEATTRPDAEQTGSVGTEHGNDGALPSKQLKLGKLLLTKSRGITNKRIKERIYEGVGVPALAGIQAEHEWIAITELEKITLPGPHRRWVKELLAKILS